MQTPSWVRCCLRHRLESQSETRAGPIRAMSCAVKGIVHNGRNPTGSGISPPGGSSPSGATLSVADLAPIREPQCKCKLGSAACNRNFLVNNALTGRLRRHLLCLDRLSRKHARIRVHGGGRWQFESLSRAFFRRNEGLRDLQALSSQEILEVTAPANGWPSAKRILS